MKENIVTLALPTEKRLKTDICNASETLDIESINSAISRSKIIPELRIVEARCVDIVKMLRSGIVDLGIIGDDKAIESGGDKYGFSSWPNSFGMRQMGLKLDKPAEMRYLFRKEDCPMSPEDFYDGETLKSVVTPYPNCLSRAVYFEKPGEVLPFDLRDKNILRALLPSRVLQVDGQTEAYLRSELYSDLAFGFDLVRSGRTAEKYGLIPSEKAVFVAYPGLWSANLGKRAPFGDYISLEPGVEDCVEKLRERFGLAFQLDERTSL